VTVSISPPSISSLQPPGVLKLTKSSMCVSTPACVSGTLGRGATGRGPRRPPFLLRGLECAWLKVTHTVFPCLLCVV
ncbi:hypothetical protein NHX12_021887, partial [Muraenolepis orangiensis]